jgi:hypothetical protein
MAYIFISYSHDDLEFVRHLIADLQAAGVNIYIDQTGLRPGTPDWDQALRDAIHDAEAVLLIASPSSRRSRFVRDELAIAKVGKKTIYPVWADGEEWSDCIPMGFGSTQYIDARGDVYADGIKQIIDVLHSVSTQTQPGITPAPPPRQKMIRQRPNRDWVVGAIVALLLIAATITALLISDGGGKKTTPEAASTPEPTTAMPTSLDATSAARTATWEALIARQTVLASTRTATKIVTQTPNRTTTWGALIARQTILASTQTATETATQTPNRTATWGALIARQTIIAATPTAAR